jgi:hypothetical protein
MRPPARKVPRLAGLTLDQVLVFDHEVVVSLSGGIFIIRELVVCLVV